MRISIIVIITIIVFFMIPSPLSVTMIFFYHIYLARVSRLMPNKFWLFVHQPGQHKQKHQQVYKVRAFYC